MSIRPATFSSPVRSWYDTCPNKNTFRRLLMSGKLGILRRRFFRGVELTALALDERPGKVAHQPVHRAEYALDHPALLGSAQEVAGPGEALYVVGRVDLQAALRQIGRPVLRQQHRLRKEQSERRRLPAADPALLQSGDRWVVGIGLRRLDQARRVGVLALGHFLE